MGKYDSSHLEALLAAQLRAVKAPPFIREHRFHAERMWRWDFCWPERKVAVEINGGGERGAHMRYHGYRNDMAKLNAGALLGWAVYWFDGKMVEEGEALTTIEQALGLPSSLRRSWVPPKKRARRAVRIPSTQAAARSRLVLP